MDQNGEITDPPADDVSSNARYAQPLARQTSAVFQTPDDSLFCPTCLKNQHLVSQALASYLPSPDAPDYAEYVKAEDEYLKGLEERYPQVCKRCEPRVQERIRAAGYAAKTDHLRRMMDRTRGCGIQYRDTSWGSPLVALGGIGWFLSLTGQTLWDGLSLLNSTEERHGLRDPRDSASGSMCLQQVMRGTGSVSDCTESLCSAAGLALLLGFLSSWWHPMLQESLRRKGGRAVGTSEFYQLQGMLLIIRWVTWWYLHGSDLKVHVTKAAHLSLLVLTTIITVKSFRSVRMDYSAPVKFQDSPGPLVSQMTQQKAAGVRTGDLGYVPQQPNMPMTRHDGGTRPFSIMDFAPPNQQRRPAIYQPPTPPPDDDDNEAMDWTPSQEIRILRPAASHRTSNAVSQQPQSFPYPEILPAQSLRNPLSQPVFRSSPETRYQESFKTPKKYTMRDSHDESPFVTPYEPSLAAGSPELSPIKFAQPRFFPPTDREDLGLESLMANNFSLAEEPREVRARQQYGKHENETQSKLDAVYAQLHGPVALLLLTISFMVWTSTPIPSLAASRMHLGLAALGIAALVILKSLLPAVRKDSDRSLSDIVLLAFELITTIIFGFALRERAATASAEDSIGPLETPGLSLIAVLIAQEAWMLYSRTCIRRMSNGNAPSPPVPQPAAAPDKSDRQQPFVGSSMSSSRQNPNVGMSTASNGQHTPALSQRTTRSRTKLENDARAPGGFGSLSLGGNARNEQALGMNSLNIWQPQSKKGKGMW